MTLLARLWALCAVVLVTFAMSSPADAQSQRQNPAGVKPRVYLMRGLGNIFSLGLDDLAAKLRERGIKATVHSYTDWQAISTAAVEEAKQGRRRPSPVVIIGHSLGADAAVYMGNRVSDEGVPVPLIVTFDPVTPTTASGAIGRVVNYYLASGSGKPVSGPKVQNINMAGNGNVGHFNIDKLADLHAQVIAMIDRPAPRLKRPRPPAPAAPSVSAPSASPTAAAPAPALAASATETAAAPLPAGPVAAPAGAN